MPPKEVTVQKTKIQTWADCKRTQRTNSLRREMTTMKSAQIEVRAVRGTDGTRKSIVCKHLRHGKAIHNHVREKKVYARLFRRRHACPFVHTYYPQPHVVATLFTPLGDLMDFALACNGCDAGITKRVASNVSSALRHIHSMGVAHLDLKAENVLLVPTDASSARLSNECPFEIADAARRGSVAFKLFDFDCASIRRTHEELMTGMRGTFMYMAPEIGAYSSEHKCPSFFYHGLSDDVSLLDCKETEDCVGGFDDVKKAEGRVKVRAGVAWLKCGGRDVIASVITPKQAEDELRADIYLNRSFREREQRKKEEKEEKEGKEEKEENKENCDPTDEEKRPLEEDHTFLKFQKVMVMDEETQCVVRLIPNRFLSFRCGERTILVRNREIPVPYDAQMCDVWALGIMLYCIHTLQPVNLVLSSSSLVSTDVKMSFFAGHVLERAIREGRSQSMSVHEYTSRFRTSSGVFPPVDEQVCTTLVDKLLIPCPKARKVSWNTALRGSVA